MATKSPYDDQIKLLNPLASLDRTVRGGVNLAVGAGARGLGVGVQGVRQLGTMALGGDTANLKPNPVTQWGQQRMATGDDQLRVQPMLEMERLGQNVSAAGLNFLGANPPAPGQDRNMNRAAPTQYRDMGRGMVPGVEPMPRDYDAEVAAAMQPAQQQQQAPGVVPQRGVYNDQTVDRGALAARTGGGNGLNFGFGGGNETARQYLDRMDQQDASQQQQATMQSNRRKLDIELAKLSSGQTIGEQVATKARIRGMQEAIAQEENTQTERGKTDALLQGEQMRGQFGLQETRLTADASRDNAMAGAEATQQAAMARAQATLEAADIGARSRVGAAQVTANGRAGQNEEDFAQAALLRGRMDLARAAEAAGDVAGMQAALVGLSPSQAQLVQNMLGVPIGEFTPGQGLNEYTPERVAQIRQNSGL